MVRAERAELMAAAERNAAEAAAAMREELAQSQTKAFERTVSGDAYENGMRHGRAAAEAAATAASVVAEAAARTKLAERMLLSREDEERAATWRARAEAAELAAREAERELAAAVAAGAAAASQAAENLERKHAKTMTNELESLKSEHAARHTEAVDALGRKHAQDLEEAARKLAAAAAKGAASEAEARALRRQLAEAARSRSPSMMSTSTSSMLSGNGQGDGLSPLREVAESDKGSDAGSVLSSRSMPVGYGGVARHAPGSSRQAIRAKLAVQVRCVWSVGHHFLESLHGKRQYFPGERPRKLQTHRTS